jgi:hypothetical protein
MKEGIWGWAKTTAAIVALVVSGVAYMHTTFASAADVQRVEQTVVNIEVQLIKQEIREIRREIMVNHLEPEVKAFLSEHLAESIVKLCQARPDDKECR